MVDPERPTVTLHRSNNEVAVDVLEHGSPDDVEIWSRWSHPHATETETDSVEWQRSDTQIDITLMRGTLEVMARDAAGNETTQMIDLPRQRYPLAYVQPPADSLLADDGPVLPVFVAVTDSDGALPSPWGVTVESGALGEPAEIAPGLRLYPWRPSRALGEQGIVVAQEDGETRRVVTMTAGPAVGMEIQAEPDILPADGLSTTTVYAGISDGLGHYLDAGPIDVEILGGITLRPPEQTGPVVLATVVADRMAPGGEPPAAIVITARGGGHERLPGRLGAHGEGGDLLARHARGVRPRVVDAWTIARRTGRGQQTEGDQRACAPCTCHRFLPLPTAATIAGIIPARQGELAIGSRHVAPISSRNLAIFLGGQRNSLPPWSVVPSLGWHGWCNQGRPYTSLLKERT